MRVALAEDGVVREALTLLLEKTGAEVAISVSSGDELLALLADCRPDAVITDLKMPPTYSDEGVQVAKKVKAIYSDIGVLVLSAYNETPQAAQLVDDDIPGVGYLLKDNVANAAALYSALTRVCAGEVVVDPDVVGRLISARRRAEELSLLSPQERRVLASMAEGLTDREIAESLFLERSTISDHAGSIFQKLGISQGPGNKRVRAVLKWLRATDCM